MWFRRDTGHLWFGSASNGFQVLAFTPEARALHNLRPPTGTQSAPAPGAAADPAAQPSGAAPPPSPSSATQGRGLPATGTELPAAAAAVLALALLVLRRRPARSTR